MPPSHGPDGDSGAAPTRLVGPRTLRTVAHPGQPHAWDRPHPEFVYSESQDRRRRACSRAHIHAVHTAHGGWCAPLGSASWLAYRLKKAQPLPAALGSAVHAVAATCVRELRAGRALPSFEAAHTQAIGALETLWRNSRRRLEHFWRRPTDTPVFLEALYGAPPSDAARLRARSKLQRVLANLLSCDAVWTWVCDAAPGDLIIPDPFSRFVLDDPVLPDGVPVYAAADLIVRPRVDGPWIIVDWKTGRADGVVDQVLVYALGALRGLRLDILASGCRGAVIALDAPFEDRVVTFPVTEDDIAEAERRVRANVASSRRLLIDAERNLPNLIDQIAGPRDAATCGRCAFRGLCHPRRYPVILPRRHEAVSPRSGSIIDPSPRRPTDETDRLA